VSQRGEDNSQSSELSDSRVSAPGSGSLIVELGEKGTVFIDSLLGLKPSNMADFERSNARTDDTLPQMSVVNGELWDAEATTEVHGSVASLEQKDGQCVIDPDSAGSRLRVAINHYLANAAGEAKSLLMLT
jgi:hypothetical protein